MNGKASGQKIVKNKEETHAFGISKASRQKVLIPWKICCGDYMVR